MFRSGIQKGQRKPNRKREKQKYNYRMKHRQDSYRTWGRHTFVEETVTKWANLIKVGDGEVEKGNTRKRFVSTFTACNTFDNLFLFSQTYNSHLLSRPGTVRSQKGQAWWNGLDLNLAGSQDANFFSRHFSLDLARGGGLLQNFLHFLLFFRWSLVGVYTFYNLKLQKSSLCLEKTQLRETIFILS